jgi:hypothetical protein
LAGRHRHGQSRIAEDAGSEISCRRKIIAEKVRQKSVLVKVFLNEVDKVDAYGASEARSFSSEDADKKIFRNNPKFLSVSSDKVSNSGLNA